MKMKTRRATAKSNELTHRERQILRWVSEGLSNTEIGRRLKVKDGKIKVHLHNIFEKLQAPNRTVLTAPRDKAGEQTDHE
jgi:two-component system nitrate/nitrite response regulator NarL